MLEIPGISDTNEIPVIEFGDGTNVLFTLPVLGAKGVSMGVMSAATIIQKALDAPRAERDAETARAWAIFVDVMADNYPTATRHLARLDPPQLSHVLKHWFEKSSELGDFDPTAVPSSDS